MPFPAPPVVSNAWDFIIPPPSSAFFTDSDSGLGGESSALNAVKVDTETGVAFDTGAYLTSTLPPPIRISYLSTVRKVKRKKKLAPEAFLRTPVIVLLPGTYPISNEFGISVEVSTLKVVLTSTETPTTTDTPRISFVLSDVGVGGEASIIANPITVDSGTSIEIASISEVIVDSGVGSETGIQKYSFTQGDTGTDSETAANTASAITGTDTGSGTDIGGASASVISNNTGVGSETVGDRKVSLVDGPYIGLESANLFTLSQKSSEENASGVDVFSLVVKLSDSETGTAIEISLVNQSIQLDTGTAVDAGLLTFKPTLTDSGSSTDNSVFTTAFIGNEFGASVEALVIQYALSVSDIGSAIENQLRNAILTASDSAVASEVISTFSKLVSESGSIYELALLDAQKFGTPETGHGTEIANIRSRELGSGRRPKLKSAN